MYERSVGVIYVLYLLCYVKRIYELREGYLGLICGDSGIIFDTGVGGECIKRVIKGVIILY